MPKILTPFPTDALQTQVGERDGQQLFIRENDGRVTAHLWAASTGQWNLVRPLLNSPDSSLLIPEIDRDSRRGRGHEHCQEVTQRARVRLRLRH